MFSFAVILWELATWLLPWEELSVFQASYSLPCTEAALTMHPFIISTLSVALVNQKRLVTAWRGITQIMVSDAESWDLQIASLCDGLDTVRHIYVRDRLEKFLSVQQIMVSVAEKGQRPDMPQQPQGGAFQGWPAYVDLIERCWAADPVHRPTFEGAITDLRELLTETATLSRQRRLEAPSNDASNPPTPRRNSGALPHSSEVFPSSCRYAWVVYAFCLTLCVSKLCS